MAWLTDVALVLIALIGVYWVIRISSDVADIKRSTDSAASSLAVSAQRLCEIRRDIDAIETALTGESSLAEIAATLERIEDGLPLDLSLSETDDDFDSTDDDLDDLDDEQDDSELSVAGTAKKPKTPDEAAANTLNL